MTPSTTIGAVSIDSSTAVWNTNAGFSLPTLLALICGAGVVARLVVAAVRMDPVLGVARRARRASPASRRRCRGHRLGRRRGAAGNFLRRSAARSARHTDRECCHARQHCLELACVLLSRFLIADGMPTTYAPSAVRLASPANVRYSPFAALCCKPVQRIVRRNTSIALPHKLPIDGDPDVASWLRLAVAVVAAPAVRCRRGWRGGRRPLGQRPPARLPRATATPPASTARSRPAPPPTRATGSARPRC